MSRLIDADALRVQMYRESFETDTYIQRWDSGRWISYKMFENVLDNAPTIEPQRMRGRWIGCDNSDHWKCSVCGTRAAFWFSEETSSELELDMSEWLSDFCPNCGSYNGGEQDVNH